VERAERFADDLIPAAIVGFVLSFALYEFFNHGAEIADGFIGKIEAIVSMLFLPGMLCSALVDGSVHDYSLGLALFINGLIYSALLFGLLRLKRHVSEAKEL
jgi:uncharacterized membrane protein YciS (DUF1049 family)